MRHDPQVATLRRMFGRTPLGWLLACLLAVSPALGQPASAADRTAARQLGQEGVALYQKGEYETALDRLSRAEALVSAPSLSLWAARSLAKLGRLVEANERYLAATRIRLEGQGLDAARLEVQQRAQADAAKERAELLPKIPKLTVRITGGALSVPVLVDGRELPAALIGVAHPIDPGKHRIELGDQAHEVTLGEGESEVVSFEAPPSAPAAPGRSTTPRAAAGGTPTWLRAWSNGCSTQVRLGAVARFEPLRSPSTRCPATTVCTGTPRTKGA